MVTSMTGSYQDLGPIGPILGISDATQQINPFLQGTGWDVIVSPDQYHTTDTNIECYHIALDGPVGSGLAILRDGHIWDYVAQGWKNGWDPSQPLQLPHQNLVQFCWNFAFTSPPYNQLTNVQPTVTLWLRKLLPFVV